MRGGVGSGCLCNAEGTATTVVYNTYAHGWCDLVSSLFPVPFLPSLVSRKPQTLRRRKKLILVCERRLPTGRETHNPCTTHNSVSAKEICRHMPSFLCRNTVTLWRHILIKTKKATSEIRSELYAASTRYAMFQISQSGKSLRASCIME